MYHFSMLNNVTIAKMKIFPVLPATLVIALAALLLSQPAAALSPDEIIAALRLPENSTGNIADAVEEATGARGWMSSDMKPIYDARIVGRAATALMRPVLRTDTRKYQNHLLEILDQAEPGSILVYVMQDGLEIAAMGNLMGTTAKVRGLAGAVIDDAVRDITELKQYDDKESKMIPIIGREKSMLKALEIYNRY